MSSLSQEIFKVFVFYEGVSLEGLDFLLQSQGQADVLYIHWEGWEVGVPPSPPRAGWGQQQPSEAAVQWPDKSEWTMGLILTPQPKLAPVLAL